MVLCDVSDKEEDDENEDVERSAAAAVVAVVAVVAVAAVSRSLCVESVLISDVSDDIDSDNIAGAFGLTVIVLYDQILMRP